MDHHGARGYAAYSGSNAICVATVLLDGGLVPMQEPETQLVLEAPGGLVRVRAACRDGKAERIFVENVSSFADRLDATLEVEGLDTLTVDTAYGGDSFVIVDAAAMGFSLTQAEAHDITTLGVRGPVSLARFSPSKCSTRAFPSTG